jgi:hypothetical protein
MYPPKVINLDDCEGMIEYIDVIDDNANNRAKAGSIKASQSTPFTEMTSKSFA